MKPTCYLILLTGLSLLGCKKEAAPPPQSTNAPVSGAATTRPSDVTPLNAPARYGGVLARSKNLATKTVSTAGLNQTVQMFYAQEGRYPKNLNELVSPNYLSQLPDPPPGMKFDYNPATGQVKVVPK